MLAALVLLLLTWLLLPLPCAAKAFPSAEGFGAADTVGGRGGRVIQVTTLADSGPGSFRACAEGTGPRICVFRVGGVVQLNSPITIAAANSYLTIAGQTAPGAGVTLTPWPLSISYGAHDVILRHVRHRQGYPSQPPNANNDCGGIIVYGPNAIRTHHVILDHVSIGYACDDSLQASGYVTDTTIQWSIVGDGYESGKGDPYGSSKGFIVGGNQEEARATEVSFHHNMLLQSGTRNPGGGPIKTLDWRYNIIYNWFACTGNLRLGGTDEHVFTTKPAHHNFVGNKYIAGPDTAQDFSPAGCWLGELREEAQTKVYVQDNETPWCGAAACPADTFLLGWGNGTKGTTPASEAQFRVLQPFPAPPITPTTRATLEAVLSKGAGATVPLRDALDTRLISELNARGGTVGRQGAPFPTLANATAGLAEKDSDNDGMPDAWEVAHGLNASDASDGPKVAANGYTNVENYLNELAGDQIPGTEPGPGPGPGPGPIPGPAGGAALYVAKTGADSHSCTAAENQATPKLTIGSALACLTTPGKRLIIKAGVYAETIDTQRQPITGGNGPTFADATTIETFGNDAVTLQVPPGQTTALWLRNGDKDHFLLIKGSQAQPLVIDAAQRPESTGIQVDQGTHHLRFEWVEVKGTVYEAVHGGGSSAVQFSDAFLHHAGYAGVVFDGTNTDWLFERVSIAQMGAQGVLHQSGKLDGLTIKESTVKNTLSHGLVVGTGSGFTLLNSQVKDTGATGVWLRAGATNVTIAHDTVYSNTGPGIQCDAGATKVTIVNTVATDNAINVLNGCNATIRSNLRDQ